MNELDLRRYPRVTVKRPARIRTSSGVVVQARLTNVSVGGLCLTYESPAEIGATLEIAFSLIVRGRQVDFKLPCVARYNHLCSDGYLIGFEFSDIDPAVRETLREFVAIKRSMQDQ